jgi:ribose 5-phosphate isomerase B
MSTPPNLSIASDHGGFHLKQALVPWLTSLGYRVTDHGPATLHPDDDYPIFAAKVARAVAGEPGRLGILLCRSGQGVAIVANKVQGVRAATAWTEAVGRTAREDDDVNVLCLPSDYVSEAEAKEIARSWLAARLKSDERYRRRLHEIAAFERENVRQVGHE